MLNRLLFVCRSRPKCLDEEYKWMKMPPSLSLLSSSPFCHHYRAQTQQRKKRIQRNLSIKHCRLTQNSELKTPNKSLIEYHQIGKIGQPVKKDVLDILTQKYFQTRRVGRVENKLRGQLTHLLRHLLKRTVDISVQNKRTCSRNSLSVPASATKLPKIIVGYLI